MKSKGIVRKVDELGRIVIPKELRDTLNIPIKTPMEILVDDDKIVLRKYAASNECVFCGDCKDTITFKGKKVCTKCFEEFGK